MNRHDRLTEGMGTAEDALGEIASTILAGRCPHEERVRLCAMQLRTAAAMLEGALTLQDMRQGLNALATKGESLFLAGAGKHPIDAESENAGKRPIPWFRQGSMA